MVTVPAGIQPLPVDRILHPFLGPELFKLALDIPEGIVLGRFP